MPKEFILFFRGGWLKPDDQPAIAQKWSVWKNKLIKRGAFIKGASLSEDGKIVFNDGQETNNFKLNIMENASGFVIIEAENLDMAIKLTKGCPIFDYNGNITIRPMEEI